MCFKIAKAYNVFPSNTTDNKKEKKNDNEIVDSKASFLVGIK